MPTILWKNILKCLPSAPMCLAPVCEEHPDVDWSLQDDAVSCISKNGSTFCSSTATGSMDLQALAASNRFFFSSPGFSNSIFESADSLRQPRSRFRNWGVAVKKYSVNPREDFKRSMEEMIESKLRKNGNGVVDFGYLHELLSCYLALNPKDTHKFVVSAFAEVMASAYNLTQSPASSSDGASTWW